MVGVQFHLWCNLSPMNELRMTSFLVVFCKKIIVPSITVSGQTMNSMVQVMQIIMDTVHIVLMKDIKNLKPT